MINIERAMCLYNEDGSINKDAKDGYPSVDVGSGKIEFRGAIGYIYVHKEVDIDKFIHHVLINAIWNKEVDEVAFRTIDNPKAHSNIKVKCKVGSTADRTIEKIVDHRGVHGHMRTRYMKNENGFVWKIIIIDNFPFEINVSDITNVLHSHVLSIFYDTNDICQLKNWEFVSTFYKKSLTGYNLILDEEICICKHYNPLAYELNNNRLEFIRNTAGVKINCFRNLITPVYSIDSMDINKLNILSSTPSRGKNTTNRYKCISCNTFLYDENYMLSAQEGEYPICPLCLHTTYKYIELNFKYVFKVKHELTIHEMIDKLKTGDEKKNIMKEILNGYKISELNTARGIMHIVEVGDKYVGVSDINSVLYGYYKTNKRVFKLIY
jgi:hypothetical protein